MSFISHSKLFPGNAGLTLVSYYVSKAICSLYVLCTCYMQRYFIFFRYWNSMCFSFIFDSNEWLLWCSFAYGCRNIDFRNLCPANVYNWLVFYNWCYFKNTFKYVYGHNLKFTNNSETNNSIEIYPALHIQKLEVSHSQTVNIKLERAQTLLSGHN